MQINKNFVNWDQIPRPALKPVTVNNSKRLWFDDQMLVMMIRKLESDDWIKIELMLY